MREAILFLAGAAAALAGAGAGVLLGRVVYRRGQRVDAGSWAMQQAQRRHSGGLRADERQVQPDELRARGRL